MEIEKTCRKHIATFFGWSFFAPHFKANRTAFGLNINQSSCLLPLAPPPPLPLPDPFRSMRSLEQVFQLWLYLVPKYLQHMQLVQRGVWWILKGEHFIIIMQAFLGLTDREEYTEREGEREGRQALCVNVSLDKSREKTFSDCLEKLSPRVRSVCIPIHFPLPPPWFLLSLYAANTHSWIINGIVVIQ